MADITFVTPRYGTEVRGGAETGARVLATGLAGEGRSVEVITTCALSSVTWEDCYQPGTTQIDGVTVHRHQVRRPRGDDFWQTSARILPRARRVDMQTALEWVDLQGPDSPDLVDAVAAVDSGVLALYPYMYQPAVRGAMVARVPTVLHAAAHEELPLDLPVFHELFATVSGFAHHTKAEQSLILNRTPAAAATPQAVVGLPVQAPHWITARHEPPLPTQEADPKERQARALPDVWSEVGIGERPYALYLGRVDPGKGTDAVVAAFARASISGAQLVLAGPVVKAPPRTRGVKVLGEVSEPEKWALLQQATVLVNPSAYESFSLVILEAWLAGTPVLANGRTAPMAEHIQASGGGLTYVGVADFMAGLRRLFADPEANRRLAQAGKSYVKRRYNWNAVHARYQTLLTHLT